MQRRLQMDFKLLFIFNLERCIVGGAGDTWQPRRLQYFPDGCTQFAGKKLTLSRGCRGTT